MGSVGRIEHVFNVSPPLHCLFGAVLFADGDGLHYSLHASTYYRLYNEGLIFFFWFYRNTSASAVKLAQNHSIKQFLAKLLERVFLTLLLEGWGCVVILVIIMLD